MPGTLYSIDVSRDGHWLAAAGGVDHPAGNSGANGSCVLWDLSTRNISHQFDLKCSAFSVCFANTHPQLAVGSQCGEIALWDFTTREQLKTWSLHSSNVYDLAFSSDDQKLASAGKDATAWLLNLSREVAPRLLLGHSQRVYGVAISPVTGQIVTGSADGALKAWRSVGSGFSQRILTRGGGAAARFSPDGGSLVDSGGLGFSVWHDVARREANLIPTLQPHAARVSWQQGGRRFVLSGHADLAPLLSAAKNASRASTVAAVDHDGDGDADRVAALGHPPQIVWQENLGDHQFTQPRLADPPDRRLEPMLVSDIDDDGADDCLGLSDARGLVLLNPQNYHHRGKDQILLKGLADPVALASADLNEDAHRDLIVATHGDDSAAWYEQLGTRRHGVPEFKEK